jgi:hypothetical protein
MSKMNFEILINELFSKINSDSEITVTNNKNLLSMVNIFEEGEWKYTNFQNFIFDNIAETSLSQKERSSLINNPHSLLTAAAKSLRLTDAKDAIGKGSELAEIVLYGIMKHHYNALPVVPKIFYKQNPQDNAKGADSVHIVLENDNDFSIWFGEAKFYDNIEDKRFDTIIESVRKSIQVDKLKKENSIITSLSDIDYLLNGEEDVKNKIKNILSQDTSIDLLKPKLHIPILLLHECTITNSTTEMSNDYKNKIINFHKNRAMVYFKKQLKEIGNTHKYSEITFHLILFPVPQKERIVDKFISEVKHYKGL